MEVTLVKKAAMYKKSKECHLPLVPVTKRNPNPTKLRCRVLELVKLPHVPKALKIELLDVPSCGRQLLVSPRVLDCGSRS